MKETVKIVNCLLVLYCTTFETSRMICMVVIYYFTQERNVYKFVRKVEERGEVKVENGDVRL